MDQCAQVLQRPANGVKLMFEFVFLFIFEVMSSSGFTTTVEEVVEEEVEEVVVEVVKEEVGEEEEEVEEEKYENEENRVGCNVSCIPGRIKRVGRERGANGVAQDEEIMIEEESCSFCSSSFSLLICRVDDLIKD